jgi:serine/threonine protein kinase
MASIDPLIGTVINGKFHVERAIARGGMGRIYFGRQAPLDRPVALKIVKADSINEEESQFLKRFLLEASILAKLQHPNVVTLFDYGKIEGAKVEMYFIAMEYLDGETLSERLRGGSLAAYETLLLFRQIARGLREAHSRGVLHRDLKPSNIIIIAEAGEAASEIVKLVDFGIGKLDSDTSGTEDLTRDGVLVGTPKYMAPEQFEERSSPASDVYALGTIMFQCLTGMLPFRGNTLPELMVAKLQHDIPSMRELNPICDATQNLEDLIRRMLMRAPDQRPSLEEVFGRLAICEEEVFGGSGPHMAGSGSRRDFGFPNSSRGIGILSTTHHMTPTPVMPVAEGPTRITGVTRDVPVPPSIPTSVHPPHSSSVHAMHAPAPSGKSSAGTIIGIAVAVGFALVSAIAIIVLKSKATTPATVPTEAPLPSPTFVLHIESNPTGALVTENGMVLGPTPLDVRVERESVGRSPRTFQLKLDGHVATSVTQGPSDLPTVSQVVSLAPDAASSTTTTTAKTPPKSTSTAAKPAAPPKPPSGKPADTSDDIRLKR